MITFADPEIVHVLPIDDLRPHQEIGTDCWCEPELKEDGRLVVHNSADGREFKERGEDFITGLV